MEYLTTMPQSGILLNMTDWLSVTEAAERTGYSAFWIRKLCRDGDLKTVRKGLMFLIDPESLDRYVYKMKSLGSAKFDSTRPKEGD